ncbi:MAG: hypothetical protein HYY16_15550 [Planctomycetes bacterium]|nr:hypothetical protein [Planctomycetota bacterium]
MNRAAFLLVTGVFWAVMMAALVKREVLPFFEYETAPSYRTMLRGLEQPQMERRAVYLGGERRGQAETVTEPRSNGHFRARSRMDLKVDAGPLGAMPLRLRTEVNIDPAYQLSDFSLVTEVLGAPIRVSGVRRGEKLLINYGTPLAKGMPSEIDFPRDMTLSDSFLPYAGGVKLSVGKKWRIQMLDMALSGVQTVTAFARVERQETIKWRGADVPTVVVEIRRRENSELPWQTLWVDEKGVVIMEQMTFDRLLYSIVLEEKRTLTPEEARAWE